jgi:hypothetical protein
LIFFVDLPKLQFGRVINPASNSHCNTMEFLWPHTNSLWLDANYVQDTSSFLPGKEDLLITMLIAVLLTIARVGVQKCCLRIAALLKVKEANKFSESCWKGLFYLPLTAAGLYLVWEGDYFPNTANCWIGHPNIPISPALRFYTLYQLGFYWHSLYAHFVYEVKRSDFWPLLLHHVATIMLIQGSYQMRFHRIGHLIVVAHDVNDVFFEIGKLFVYLGKETITNVLFIFLLLSWVTTRLGIFPFMLIRTAIFEGVHVMGPDLIPFWATMNVFLVFLLGLHVYWFSLMLRMAARVVRGKEKKIVDSRESQEPHGTRAKPQKKPEDAAAAAAAADATASEGDDVQQEQITQHNKRK